LSSLHLSPQQGFQVLLFCTCKGTFMSHPLCLAKTAWYEQILSNATEYSSCIDISSGVPATMVEHCWQHLGQRLRLVGEVSVLYLVSRYSGYHLSLSSFFELQGT
jgi:hypothetical protein